MLLEQQQQQQQDEEQEEQKEQKEQEEQEEQTQKCDKTMCSKMVTSFGMKRTSHCVLHLHSRAEHMNNINAHTAILNPYDIAAVRNSTIYCLLFHLMFFQFFHVSSISKPCHSPLHPYHLTGRSISADNCCAGVDAAGGLAGNDPLVLTDVESWCFYCACDFFNLIVRFVSPLVIGYWHILAV